MITDVANRDIVAREMFREQMVADQRVTSEWFTAHPHQPQSPLNCLPVNGRIGVYTEPLKGSNG